MTVDNMLRLHRERGMPGEKEVLAFIQKHHDPTWQHGPSGYFPYYDLINASQNTIEVKSQELAQSCVTVEYATRFPEERFAKLHQSGMSLTTARWWCFITGEAMRDRRFLNCFVFIPTDRLKLICEDYETKHDLPLKSEGADNRVTCKTPHVSRLAADEKSIILGRYAQTAPALAALGQ